MKNKVTIEKATCDFCTDKDQTWQTCFRCGKDVCYKCRTRYAREMYIDSSADPCACPDCAAIIENDPSILGPLAEIVALKAEADAWNDGFRKRKERAEKAAKDFTPKGRKP